MALVQEELDKWIIDLELAPSQEAGKHIYFDLSYKRMLQVQPVCNEVRASLVPL